MVSVGQMIKRISGLCGTNAVDGFENKFIEDVVESTKNGEHTSTLRPKQVELIERIHGKHFV